jgi:hypothetical protein
MKVSLGMMFSRILYERSQDYLFYVETSTEIKSESTKNVAAPFFMRKKFGDYD